GSSGARGFSARRDATVGEAGESREQLAQVARAAHRVERVAVAPDLDPVVLASRDEVAGEVVPRQCGADEIDPQVPASVFLRGDRDSVFVLPLAVALRGVPRPQLIEHPPPFPTRSVLAPQGIGSPGDGCYASSSAT